MGLQGDLVIVLHQGETHGYQNYYAYKNQNLIANT